MPAYGIESRKGQGIDAKASHSNLKNLPNAVVKESPPDPGAVRGIDISGADAWGEVGSGSGIIAGGNSALPAAAAAASWSPAVPGGGVLQTHNMWRDTELRYLGYANELGEAFKATIPRAAYYGTYGVACLYVAADARHQGLAAAALHPGGEGKGAAVTTAVVDTAVWQGLASVAIPGYADNSVKPPTPLLL